MIQKSKSCCNKVILWQTSNLRYMPKCYTKLFLVKNVRSVLAGRFLSPSKWSGQGSNSFGNDEKYRWTWKLIKFETLCFSFWVRSRWHTLFLGASGSTGSSTASNTLLIKMTAKMKSSKYRRFTTQWQAWRMLQKRKQRKKIDERTDLSKVFPRWSRPLYTGLLGHRSH